MKWRKLAKPLDPANELPWNECTMLINNNAHARAATIRIGWVIDGRFEVAGESPPRLHFTHWRRMIRLPEDE